MRLNDLLFRQLAASSSTQNEICFQDLGWGGGVELVATMPRCVCPKVKDKGPFLTSRE